MATVIGLAGNIGSGKSLAASILQELGAAAIDADALARLVVQPGHPAYKDICQTFGWQYLLEDGSIDRKKLGNMIFADAEARERLNAITHPRIREEAAKLIAQYQAAGYAMIVLEAALLLEAGSLRDLLDEIWLVMAPQMQICSRLAERDALTPQQAAMRLAAQMPQEQQAALADRVILNDGSKEELQQKLEMLYRESIKMSQ